MPKTPLYTTDISKKKIVSKFVSVDKRALTINRHVYFDKIESHPMHCRPYRPRWSSTRSTNDLQTIHGGHGSRRFLHTRETNSTIFHRRRVNFTEKLVLCDQTGKSLRENVDAWACFLLGNSFDGEKRVRHLFMGARLWFSYYRRSKLYQYCFLD